MDIGLAKVEMAISHRVGNKARDEGVSIANNVSRLSDETKGLILGSLLGKIYKSSKEYEFFHESNISLNEVLSHQTEAFSEKFYTASVNLAKFLYSKSSHPSTPGGELLVVLFSDVLINETKRKALGLFKIDKKERFIQISEKEDDFQVTHTEGIDAREIQKAALIIEGEKTVHALEKKNEVTKYWIEDFLKVRPIQSEINLAGFAAKFVKRVSDKIEDVGEKAEYKIGISKILDQEETSISDIADVCSRFLPPEAIKETKNQIENNVGIRINDELPFPSSLIRKKIKPLIQKFTVTHGLDISLIGKREVASVKSIPNQEDNVFLIRIELKEENHG